MPSPTPPPCSVNGPLQHGSRELRGLRLAMFLCGFCCVAMLHGTQPLLPEIAGYFEVTSASASWALSATMLALALMLLPAGLLSDRLGRRAFLLGGLGLASLATLAAALAPRFADLLIWRTVTGLVLAGVPAIALAYLSEEVAPGIVGRTIALYAAGNALGGVSGRLAAGALGEWQSWRLSLLAIGILSLLATLALVKLLPRERQFRPVRHNLGASLQTVMAHWRNAELRRYFAIGFLLMGTFISLYSSIGFHLMAPPFALSLGETSLLFLLLLLGIPVSMLCGHLVDTRGPWLPIGGGTLLMLAGLLGMLAPSPGWLGAGLVVFTVGYFFSYTASNGSVTRRAPFARGTAAGIYLSCFYSGGALINVAASLAWEWLGWPGVVLLLGSCLILILCLWSAMPRRETAQG